MVVLAAMSALFIPFSVGWYDAIESHCVEGGPKAGVQPTLQAHDDCGRNVNFHWAIFYGVNGAIFGLPAVALALTRRNTRP